MAQSAQIKKVNIWHERLCDWLIANPGVKRSEAAKLFKVTESWLSTVINSDVFQDYYRERSTAISDAVDISLKAKMTGTADMAVQELQRRLEHPQVMTTDELLSITDVMTKRVLPSGTPPPSAGSALQQVVIVSRDDLAAARAAMRQRALPSPQPAIANGVELEGEAVEIVSVGGSDQ